MGDERKGGLALIASSAALLATMALHPVPHEDALKRGVAVHILAMLASPVALYGALALSKRLGARLAACFQVFALVVGMFAPIMSGFVPLLGPSHDVARFAWMLNQTCTRIWVTGTAIAIALWSFASWRRRLLPRPLTIYGYLSAAAVIGFVFSGLPFDVHHTAIVALLQAIYSIAAGAALLRSGSAPALPAPGAVSPP
jgi:hypothetical protein